MDLLSNIESGKRDIIKKSQIGSPYSFQRDRTRLINYPRPAQPNTFQPNQREMKANWWENPTDYWLRQYTDYIKRRQ